MIDDGSRDRPFDDQVKSSGTFHMEVFTFHMDAERSLSVDLSDPARAVMTPSVSAVLRVLVRAAPAEFTLREVAGLAAVSHNTAQTVVHRLADHGLVVVRPAGRALMCTFNTEHLAADAVTALVTLRVRLVQALVEELSGWSSRPVHASLFGSGGRGDGDLHSDLDVLVVRPELPDTAAEHTWDGELAESTARLRRRTGNPVNMVETTREGLRRAVLDAEPLVAAWLRDGVHLVGQRLDALLAEVA